MVNQIYIYLNIEELKYHMSIVDKFGEKVGEIAEKLDHCQGKEKLARDIDYRKKLALFPDRKLQSGTVCGKDYHLNNIIQALAKATEKL